jgi:hypothetical protein
MRLQSQELLRGASVFVLIVLLGPLPKLCGETFTNPRILPTGSNPSGVFQGDFNGDGKPDLIYTDAALHVLLGNGDGTFRPGQNIAFPSSNASVLAVADVNLDGKLDLILGVSGTQPAIAVMLGNGDGTFQPAIVTQVPLIGPNWSGLAGCGVADFNGDGAPDLVVTDASNNGFYVLLGNNTGAFAVKQQGQQFTGPTTVFTGDFNGDGRQDFILFDRLSADVAVFLGNGDGTFQAGVRYQGPGQIWSVLPADMDGDGHPDLVVTGPQNSLYIYHGNSDGTFATTAEAGPINFGAGVFAVKDFNGDGILDVAGIGTNGITILFGKGNLTYGSSPALYGAGPSTTQAAMADFNLDGNADFVVPAPGGLALLFGNSDGSLQTFPTYYIGAPASSLAIGDFNGDGVPDIAVCQGTVDPLIMLGQGAGKFNLTQGSNVTTSAGNGQILTGDFNGDGKTDLLIPGNISEADTVLYGNGDGTFLPVSMSGLSVNGFNVTAVADFNHDGVSDFAATGYEALNLALGQKNETFVISSILMPDIGTAAPAFGDFNNDGKLDMVVGGTTTMQILLGNGDGTFQMGRLLQTEINGGMSLNEPMVLVTGDFDGDGNIDIIALMSSPPVLEMWYGNGDGTFNAPFVLQISRPYTQMASADVNGDGKPDLILSDGNIIAVIHNNGNRSYGPEVPYLAGPIGSFVVQDVNGDGNPDIVVANGGSATSVATLLNEAGGPSLTGTLTISPEPSPHGQPYTMTVSIQALNSGGGTPTGTVYFYYTNSDLATVTLGTATLSNGTVSFTDTSSPPLGTYTVVAQYTGDATFSPSEFAVEHTVVPVVYPTTTTLAAAPNPALAGQTVSFTATVASAGPQSPGRWVTFYEGSTTAGTAWLNNGVAVFDTALLSLGTHNVVAAYSGDTNSAPSTSAVVAVVINAYTTSTALSALPSTAQVGANVSLQAVVTSSSGTPAGSAVFLDGTTALAAQPLDASGSAIYTATFNTAGTHSLTAMYRQNGRYAASTSSVLNLVVGSAGAASPSATLLEATWSSGGADSVTLTATVKAPHGTPSGAVAFVEGSSQIGEAAIGPTGVASYTSASLAQGTHYLTAYYTGDSKFAASVSSGVLVDALAKRPDFSIGGAPASARVPLGQSATVQLAITPRNGFSSNVSLSCSTGTSDLSCSLEPAMVASGSGTARLTITTLSHRSSHLPLLIKPAHWRGLWAGAIVLGLLPWLMLRSARCRLALCALCLLCLVTAWGCGAATEPTPAPANNYVVTVTANSLQSGAAIVHAVQVQVTVSP